MDPPPKLLNRSKQFVTVRKKGNFGPLSSKPSWQPPFPLFTFPPPLLFFPWSVKLNRMNLIPSPSPPPLRHYYIQRRDTRVVATSVVAIRMESERGRGREEPWSRKTKERKIVGGGDAGEKHDNTITMGGDHHVDSYWTRATPSTSMNLSGQVTREQLTPNFWRIVSMPLLVSDGSPPAAPFLAHRRYCLCELFSPCWRFTLATSTDGLLPLSFSVGGILAETKNFSSFFFGRSFWLFWCELFVSVGVIPRFTRRVESSSSFKLFFRLS